MVTVVELLLVEAVKSRLLGLVLVVLLFDVVSAVDASPVAIAKAVANAAAVCITLMSRL